MNHRLDAEFEKRYPGGPAVRFALSDSSEGCRTTALFGPSGCGKTTILRCLAGLERPEFGHIHFENQTWFDATRRVFLPPQSRDIGFLFQDYALFPHLTVTQNLSYGLRTSPREARRRRVSELMELFQLVGTEQRYPNQLSGGQQQRVALARAVARRPRLLLLDEPLSALDGPTREDLRGRLRRFLADLDIPTMLVTHDRIEAISLADRVVVLDQGEVLQTGPVEEVFSRPANVVVARIVGVETVVGGRVMRMEGGLATVLVGGVEIVAVAREEIGPDVFICIQAEEVILQTNQAGPISTRNRLRGRVRSLTPEGPLVRVELDCGFRLTSLVTRLSSEELRLHEGMAVIALLKAPSVHLIERGT